MTRLKETVGSTYSFCIYKWRTLQVKHSCQGFHLTKFSLAYDVDYWVIVLRFQVARSCGTSFSCCSVWRVGWRPSSAARRCCRTTCTGTATPTWCPPTSTDPSYTPRPASPTQTTSTPSLWMATGKFSATLIPLQNVCGDRHLTDQLQSYYCRMSTAT